MESRGFEGLGSPYRTALCLYNKPKALPWALLVRTFGAMGSAAVSIPCYYTQKKSPPSVMLSGLVIGLSY